MRLYESFFSFTAILPLNSLPRPQTLSTTSANPYYHLPQTLITTYRKPYYHVRPISRDSATYHHKLNFSYQPPPPFRMTTPTGSNTRSDDLTDKFPIFPQPDGSYDIGLITRLLHAYKDFESGDMLRWTYQHDDEYNDVLTHLGNNQLIAIHTALPQRYTPSVLAILSCIITNGNTTIDTPPQDDITISDYIEHLANSHTYQPRLVTRKKIPYSYTLNDLISFLTSS